QLTATISDGLGNSRTTTRSVLIVPALAVSAAASTLGFDIGVPDVGDAWLGVGRELHRITQLGGTTRRATLDGTIKAIAPLGDRLLCALDGVGLSIIDPNTGYTAAATLPLSAALGHMAASEELALLEVGG